MDLSQIELLGIPLINVDGLIEMLVRFAVTMLFSFIIIGSQ